VDKLIITSPSVRLSCVIIIIIIVIVILTWSPSLTATAQQQTTTTTGTGAATTTQSLTPPLTPPLTLQEQEQQTRLQNVIASTTLNLQETQKQISGVVFTPRWSQPVWVNANSVAVLVAYCLPGEFADSGQEILGGFELEILESYAVALPQGYMVWMAVVGNEDLQNRRFPAALGVICASDLNKPETRVLSPQKQQEINKINEQFVNIQNTQITDIDNIINVINTVTTTTTTTTAIPPPTTPQNPTGGAARGATTPAAAPVQDTTPPTLIVPEDIVVNATGEQGAVVTYIVTAQDNVDGAATLDENNILIQDNATSDVYANVGGGTPPMPGAGGGNVGTMTPTPPAPAPAPNAPVSGGGGGDISIVCNLPSGSTFPIGTQTVQCRVTDAAGNAVTASFTITVNGPTTSPPTEPKDTTPPVITVPGDIEVWTTSEEGAVVTYTVTAKDNVDGTAMTDIRNSLSATQDNVGGSISLSCRQSSNTVFDVDDTPVQCNATDAAGNRATTASFYVVVNLDLLEDPGETAQVVQEEEPPPPASPAEGGEEQGEGETTDAEALLPPPAGEEQQPPASEEGGEGGEEENEGEPSEE
jgi:hypothetical protein